MTVWKNCLPSDQLTAGQVREISWQNEDLLLYRTESGDCHALNAYCPHMGNYMPNGLKPNKPLSCLLQNSEIHCPFHGWVFDCEGRCTHIPPGQRIPIAVSNSQPITRTWGVREYLGQIQLSLD